MAANGEGQDMNYEDMMTQSNIEDLDNIFVSLGVNVNDIQELPAVEPEIKPEMELNLSNRMIRLRYDSELSNRNKGKEELIQVVIKNYQGPVYIRMQTVDISNHKAHPFSLIGECCDKEIYFKKFDVSAGSPCICKATLRIPKKQDYEKVLQTKHQAYKDNLFRIVLDQMKSGDYWTCNKSLKDCTDFRLHVEAFYQNGEGWGHLEKISETLVNAKDGKNFEIHRVIPYAVSVDGIHEMSHSLVIILTADSYVPKKVKVIFTDDNEWTETASHTNVIKNVIECTVPPYRVRDITQPQKISIIVEDTQKKMSTEPRDMEYIVSMADMDTTDRKRKKPTPSYNVPEQLQSSIRAHTSSQSAPSSTSRLQLKGKLRQKCQGPVNQQSVPNMLNLTSLPELIVRGASNTSSSTVSMGDLSMVQVPLMPFSAQNQFSSVGSTEGQSVANILAPSGAQIPQVDNKPPKDFFHQYLQEANREQLTQQQQQQQQQQLYLGNQHHSLLIGNQDSSMGMYDNDFQSLPTLQNQHLLVNPTTLEPEISDSSNLDFFDDIETDSSPNKLDKKTVTTNKKTDISHGSGEEYHEDVTNGEKPERKQKLKTSEEKKGKTSKEQKKSETDPEECCKTGNQKSVKNNKHAVCTAETSTDIKRTESDKIQSSKSDVKISDQNQKSKSDVEKSDKNQKVIYQRGKEGNVLAECPKSNSLECKELAEALPTDDLESDGC